MSEDRDVGTELGVWIASSTIQIRAWIIAALLFIVRTLIGWHFGKLDRIEKRLVVIEEKVAEIVGRHKAEDRE